MPSKGRKRAPYPPEFRRQMVDLVRAGRTPEELITPSRAGGLKGNRHRRLQRILGQEMGLHEDASFNCN
jgi:hypothetical protein